MEISEEVQANGNGHSETSETPVVVPKAKLAEICVTDYMEACLDKVAYAEGFKNYVIKVVHGSAIGDGFIGLIFKVSITEVDSDKNLNLVLKTPPTNEARKNQFGAMGLFKREVYMYNVVLPEFVKFQHEKKISESMGFFNFPKVYFAEFDEEKNDSLIIMEDLRESGFKLYNKYKTTDYEHAKLLMTSLGRFHAISFGLKICKPDIFEPFKELTDFFAEQFSNEQMLPMLQGSIDQAIGILDESDVKSKERLEKLKDNCQELLKTLTSSQNAEPFAVVGHGDCWSNNFMYQYKGGAPSKICLLDFQISRYCSPVLDLLYFIFACTSGELRKTHYDDLLGIYHRSLKDLLDHLGGDTQSQFPYTAFLRQLKKFGKFGIYMATIIVPVITKNNEDIPDMDYLAENTNLDDPEQMKEMMGDWMKVNNLYSERMKPAIHDAIRYGYF